jgi:hypothetical protein
LPLSRVIDHAMKIDKDSRFVVDHPGNMARAGHRDLT